jgi:fucose permease
MSLRRVSLIACIIGVGVCGLSSLADDVTLIIAWGASLGGVISICGTLSNIYTQRSASPIHRTRAMAASHASYGFASFLAPVAVAYVLSSNQPWSNLYYYIFPVFLSLAAYCLIFAPDSQISPDANSVQPLTLTFPQVIDVTVVLFYVTGEVLVSMWMTAWLVEAGRTINEGAVWTSVFFVLMTATRLLCSFFLTRRWENFVLVSSLVFSILFFILGKVFTLPLLIACTGFLGPFFPLFVARTSIKFPNSDRTIVIWIISMMQLVLALMNLSVGKIAASFNIGTAYWLPPGLIAISAALLLYSLRRPPAGNS